jgi:sphingolipid 8-(E)-desaturase
MMVLLYHVAGHSGITHNRKYDTMYGIFLADFFGGLSMGWWKHSHYVHHIITNHPEHDPDIQHLPFFAVSTQFTKNLYSTFHQRILTFDWAARYFVPHQHKLYYIILAFGRFNLYVQSWVHVLTRKQVFYRRAEIACMLGFWVWFGWMLSHLPKWYHVVGFVLVSHMVTFILHVQITLSHFGMSTEEVVGREETFAERQLRTSMDVECPPWLDWFHGGLQVKQYNIVSSRTSSLPSRTPPSFKKSTTVGQGICKETQSCLSFLYVYESQWVCVGDDEGCSQSNFSDCESGQKSH